MAELSDRPIAAARQVQAFLQTADLLRLRCNDVAEHYGISETALHKRLRRGGTTYKALLDAERRRRLHRLLYADRIIPKRDAEVIGFCHATGFLKFFKDTMGMTLREWRRQRAAA